MITITRSPMISAFLLQYYFEILNVLDNSNASPTLLKDHKHKENEKIIITKIVCYILIDKLGCNRCSTIIFHGL